MSAIFNCITHHASLSLCINLVNNFQYYYLNELLTSDINDINFDIVIEFYYQIQLLCVP